MNWNTLPFLLRGVLDRVVLYAGTFTRKTEDGNVWLQNLHHLPTSLEVSPEYIIDNGTKLDYDTDTCLLLYIGLLPFCLGHDTSLAWPLQSLVTDWQTGEVQRRPDGALLVSGKYTEAREARIYPDGIIQTRVMDWANLRVHPEHGRILYNLMLKDYRDPSVVLAAYKELGIIP